MRARILIMPKKGLLDPEGRAVKEMLEENGFEVGEVKVGKVVELEVKEGTDIRQIAEKFLVNPLIEEYV
ncbi:MAG: phosphoribosylformylglycinamidine synthase, purS protein, partial [Aquificota bacterium]